MTPISPSDFITLAWCPELSSYVARCPSLFPGALHGPDPTALQNELFSAIDAAFKLEDAS